MDEIANRMSTALGSAGAERAAGAIAHQMQKLLAADVIYERRCGPKSTRVLEINGINDSDVPRAPSCRTEMARREHRRGGARRRQRRGHRGETAGCTGSDCSGSASTEPNWPTGHRLAVGEETPELEVQVQNQGESTENEVIGLGQSQRRPNRRARSKQLGAGEEGTATIPLTPAPSGEVTIEVEVETVPGEQVAENNTATYTIMIE